MWKWSFQRTIFAQTAPWSQNGHLRGLRARWSALGDARRLPLAPAASHAPQRSHGPYPGLSLPLWATHIPTIAQFWSKTPPFGMPTTHRPRLRGHGSWLVRRAAATTAPSGTRRLPPTHRERSNAHICLPLSTTAPLVPDSVCVQARCVGVGHGAGPIWGVSAAGGASSGRHGARRCRVATADPQGP